jgi:DNA-binding NarL/FixJ family response regulator
LSSIRILLVDDFKALRNKVLSLLQVRPKLNGIEAARRIRQLAPNSNIVFLSSDNSPDVVQVALSTGALGYVHKVGAESDLVPAIDAALRGEQFASSSLISEDKKDGTQQASRC